MIYGVNSTNKGAQLLLATAASRLVAAGHTPVVSVRDVRAPERKSASASGYFSVEKLGPARSLGLDLLPRIVASRLPIAGDASFDYVLDASGYSLTDAWGTAPALARLSRMARWRRRGIGYSMLPQALGPITKPELVDAVMQVLENTDRIWVRDERSQQYAQELTSNPVNVAPDITTTFTVKPAPVAQGAVVVVPNWNLAKRGTDGVSGDRYVSTLIEITEKLSREGRKTVVMNHEGAGDLSLAKQVVSAVPNARLVDPATGSECKAILAGASAVVAGRYHALVSALSSGVPSVGHSWAHKYAALMSDFGVEDGLADVQSADETLRRLQRLETSDERNRLRNQKIEVARKVEEVWSDVLSALEAHSRTTNRA